jgi:cytochrome c peroxidase
MNVCRNRRGRPPGCTFLRLALLCLVAAWLATPALVSAKPFEWNLPRGYPPPFIPEDNPMSWEKVELGRLLFYDKRMSGNETFACASCHQQELAFTDGLPQAMGSTGGTHLRASMSLVNIGYNGALTWANPSLFLLENQALTPMFGDDPIVELGLTDRFQLLDRLQADARYRRMFAEAFPQQADPFSGDVGLDNVTKSIASFQRTLISFNAPVDRYLTGVDDRALSASALRGMDLFYTTVRPNGKPPECNHCHGNQITFGSTFTSDGSQLPEAGFSNTALYALHDGPCPPELSRQTGELEPGNYPPGNRGAYELIHDCPNKMGYFKAPTLRNIAVTAPYMHDGSIATLDEVIDHYAAGGRAPNNPYKSEFLSGFTVNAQERQDLLAFLDSLTDEEFLTNPKFADPFLAPLCPGDCDYDGAVDLDELVTSVAIEMGSETLASCIVGDPNGDGAIDVAEMIQAVNGALKGCPEPLE